MVASKVGRYENNVNTISLDLSMLLPFSRECQGLKGRASSPKRVNNHMGITTTSALKGMTSVSNRGVNKHGRGIKSYDFSALLGLQHYYRFFTMSEDNKMSGAASSGTTGFFQQTPTVANSFYEDEGYKRVFSCEPQLHFTSFPCAL